MAVDTVNIGSAKAVYVKADATERKLVTNRGGTVYYGAETVSSGTNDGNVTTGSSTTLSVGKWFISASSSQLTISDVADETLAGNQVVGGNLAVTGDAAVTGNSVVTGTSTVTGASTLTGDVEIDGAINHDGSTVGFYNVTPATRPTATTDLKDGLTTQGLVQGTSATPLNLDGGAFTAAAISGTTGTLSSTLGVTGATTVTGGIVAGGTPRIHTVVPTSLTYGTDATPVATETYFAEIVVPVNTTLTGIRILVGSVGGTDSAVVALFDSAGVPVAWSALAGTVVGTTAAWQTIAFTGTYAAKGPAQYFVGLQVNGNTARFRAIPVGPQMATGKKTSEVFGTLTTITAPTTFTADLGPVATTY